MNEKLTIRNFGPITSVNLELRNVNVLIGDQGTGKSTIAKVLLLVKGNCSMLSGDRSLSIADKKITDEEELENYLIKEFKRDFWEGLKAFDLEGYFTNESFIFFENNVIRVEISGDSFSFKRKAKCSEVEKDTNVNYFIPAYREAYMLLRNNYPAILNAKANLPTLLNTFGQQFNNFRQSQYRFDFSNIIGIKYQYLNGKDIILLEDGKEINFEESSSAINSVTPMLVVFKGIVNDMSRTTHRILYFNNRPYITIEEPELNCFPETQKKLVEYFIKNIKVNDYLESNEFYCNLFITTHSPYILTTLNNLLYAYQIGSHNDLAENVIAKEYWLKKNHISAYKLMPGGTCKEILAEDGLIKAEEIDTVSAMLNNEFDQLLDIEFRK